MTLLEVPEQLPSAPAPESPADLEGDVLAAMRAGDARAFAAALRRAADAGAAWASAVPLGRCVNAACASPRLAPFLAPLLRAPGVDPNAPLRHRAAGAAPLPPLHAAAASSNPGAVALLLADPRTRPQLLDEARRTALHHAVVPRREDCLERARACVMLLLGQVPPDTWATAVRAAGDCEYSSEGPAPPAGAPHIDIDAPDTYQCTALHYAARYADERMVLTLLRCGAFMGARDRFGHSALRDIGGSALETHLDECLRSKNAKSPQEYMYSMIFTFTFLPTSPSHVPDSLRSATALDPEACSTSLKPSAFASEMSVLVQLSHMRCSRHLLKHPVITLFLNMKWHKIKYIFYCNILTYTIYLITLNFHLITRPGFVCAQLRQERDSPNATRPLSPLPQECDDSHNIGLEIVLFICLTVFMLREALRLLIWCRKNFFTVEIYVKVLSVIFTVMSMTMSNTIARQHISALTILLSWLGLFFLTGNMPVLSIQLEMLKKVCGTFLRFMTWYSILVIGFSLTFCILLNNGQAYAVGSVHSFFLGPWLAIFKTIVMMAGEFDAIELPLSTFPVTSHIIFIVFVFLISIVLLNLLNGLAVSDTQAIKEEAEVFSLVARVRTISQIEESLIHLTNLRGLRRLLKLCWVQHMYRRVFIFPFFHSSKEIRVYPNWKENNVVVSRPDDSNEYFHVNNWSFKRSVDAAIHVVLKRRKGAGGLCVKMTRLRNELRESLDAMERRVMAALEGRSRRGLRFSKRCRASYKSC